MQLEIGARRAAANLSLPMDELQQVATSAPTLIGAAQSLEELKAAETELLGKNSVIAQKRRGLGGLDPADRPTVGAKINEVFTAIQATLSDRKRQLEIIEENVLLVGDRVDVTVPHVRSQFGTQHILTTVMDEVSDIFVSLGYRVATGPEVETAWYNFDALNTPSTHPARAESDTLYVDFGDPADEMLLRTQTSPVQARYMQQHEPPVHVVVPGRVFRSDSLDATHSPVFHQVEGLVVDTDITFADLKGTLEYFAKTFFGAGRVIKLIPHFFPFTEPSAEMHVSCFACDGSGCRVCSNSGWIELMGCGMVDPNVFEAVGYDPSKVSGFAFGMGVERLAMVRHGITHIKHFFENDLRVLGQFV